MSKSETQSAMDQIQTQQVLKRLRALCNPQIDLDIPRIAVIGDRSAGITSLMEAISGIPLPDVCGRCPVEYRMSPSEDTWKCQISIWGEVPGSDPRRYKIEEVLFGDATYIPQAAETRIRHAYASNLNPGTEPMLFLNMHEAELNEYLLKSELQYSWNPIYVDIVGPGMDDIVFVVLPRFCSDNDAEVARFTDELARSYLQRRCLILVAMTVSENVKASKAMSLAKHADPAGSRTISAINRLNSHAAELPVDAKRWDERCLTLVEGRDHRVSLPLGYYCIRQPTDVSRSTEVTHSEVRQIEDAFFRQALPWAESTCPQRLGTRNLVGTLSRLLNDLVYKSLPGIMEDATRKLSECNAQLANLPPCVEEPTSFVLSLVSRICTRVHALVEGAPGQGSFVQACRSSYRSYRTAICTTGPAFMPFPNSASGRPNCASKWTDQLLALDGEDRPAVAANRYIYLDDVRARIAQTVTHELPATVPYALNVLLIQDFQRQWADLTDQCLAEVHGLLHDAVRELVQEASGPYAQLSSAIERITDGFIQTKVDSARSRAVRLLEYERTPFTQLDSHLKASKARLLALYKKAYQDTKADDGKARGISPGPPSIAAHQSSTPVAAAASPGLPQHAWPVSLSASDTPKPAFSSASLAVSAVAPSGCPGTAWRTHFDGTPGSSGELGTGSSTTLLMAVVCMEDYARWSFEELRLADYLRGFAPMTRALPKLTIPSHLLFPARPDDARNNALSQAWPITAGTVSSGPSPRSAVVPGTSNFATSYSGASPPAPPTPAHNDRSRTHGPPEPWNTATAANPGNEDHERIADGPYGRELEVMAEVRAYFEIAYKRVVDNIPLTIQHELLRAFAAELNDHLVRRLGLGAPGADVRCAEYLAEDEETLALREKLESARLRLGRMRDELSGLGL